MDIVYLRRAEIERAFEGSSLGIEQNMNDIQTI